MAGSIPFGFVPVSKSVLGFCGRKGIGTVYVPNRRRVLYCQGRAVLCVLHLSQAMFYGPDAWNAAGLNLERSCCGCS